MNRIEIPWDVIEKAVWEADLDPEDVIYRNYSGRYMYGRTCLGIVSNLTGFANFLLALEREDHGSEASELAERVTTDSMGLSTIFYFPGIRVAEDCDYDERGC